MAHAWNHTKCLCACVYLKIRLEGPRKDSTRNAWPSLEAADSHLTQCQPLSHGPVSSRLPSRLLPKADVEEGPRNICRPPGSRSPSLAIATAPTSIQTTSYTLSALYVEVPPKISPQEKFTCCIKLGTTCMSINVEKR